MKPDTNNHSVFMLHYHLIMCIKYRNEVIDDTISNRLNEIFVKIAPAYNITLEEWNHDVDHVHILFRGQPNTEISKFINAYKSASSCIIKKEFPEIRKSLWKEMFWSQSFCLLTTGKATVDIINNTFNRRVRKMASKAINYRAYPTAEQSIMFAKTFGSAVRSITLCFPIRLKATGPQVSFLLLRLPSIRMNIHILGRQTVLPLQTCR